MDAEVEAPEADKATEAAESLSSLRPRQHLPGEILGRLGQDEHVVHYT